MTQESPLLEVRDLRRYFGRGRFGWRSGSGPVRAVDGVSFSIKRGSTLGLVGESGCGKTTTARLVLSIDRPTSGTIAFRGADIARFGRAEQRRFKQAVQAVFQDPWSSLNPRMRAGDIISEPLVVNRQLSRRELRLRVDELLLSVGLEPAVARNYPHEFSGGQRQRIAVARALSLNPELIVLDEPVSALDVSIRAQLMNLLKDLQTQFDTTYLLIAHNLATVRFLSQRTAVMYLGVIVEEGASSEVFDDPLHPYTRALLSAARPVQPHHLREEIILRGDVPSPSNVPPGCRFHTRCPLAFERCSREVPELRPLGRGRKVACHLY